MTRTSEQGEGKLARVKVTRRVHFSAAHRLGREDWTPEENRRVFGDCSNPNWHGHNYELDVTVAGEVDESTGFVYDLKDLRDTVERLVLADVDHRNLNLDVDWLHGRNPTTENLVVAIWQRLTPALPAGVQLERLVLWETPRNYVEYCGE
ncbi:MAG: 6-carboxytetrahydropterin synthase [Gemmatimonadetes bacterium]|nr:6-carboxytetrahydropterin synthase [Gemmatimonadota bacterium]